MTDLKLPKIGFGTWKLKGKTCKESVLSALEIGYRHIDTAQLYGNEKQVGEALAEATVDRKDLIIATKVSLLKLRPKSVISSTYKSLEKLQLDYVDILYVHWPAMFYKARKTLPAFSQLVDEKKVRYIGVSNFTPALIEEAIAACDKPIAVNQVEHHPLLKQEELREFLPKKNMLLVAYSPLARGNVFKVPELTQIAKKHRVSEAQVSLAWIMHHGAYPIPKATGEAHIKDCYEAINLELDDEDITLIDSIKMTKRCVNPPFVRPKW
ncbi:MAG: aldo/keto reductase [Candidatus Helarchaeales archaeon]